MVVNFERSSNANPAGPADMPIMKERSWDYLVSPNNDGISASESIPKKKKPEAIGVVCA